MKKSYLALLLFIFSMNLFGQETGKFTDLRDGNEYEWVKIGDQTWMAENLKAIQYTDGTPLIDGTGVGDITGDDTTKYYFWLEDDSLSYAETYGALYTWAAAMNGEASSDANPSGVQGVCPNGWHLPNDAEWKELEMFLGMSQEEADMEGFRGTDEGGKLKGTTHWEDPNTGATNSSGFTALPADIRALDGDTDEGGVTAVFWSSTESDSSNAWLRFIENVYAEVSRFYYYKGVGISVRCLRDELNLPPVADAGPDQDVIEGDTVTLDGKGSSDSNGDSLSFIWTAPAALGLSDSTSASPTFTAPEVIADTIFVITLVVNDGSLGSDPDTVLVNVLQATSAGYIYANPDIMLQCYPNPTNDLLTIETEYPDHYSINITTLNGQLIYSTTMEGTSHQIDLSSFQKGVYFITIRSKDFVTTRKVIKL
jgi:uncharacterized protein (TIGR02145 family)